MKKAAFLIVFLFVGCAADYRDIINNGVSFLENGEYDLALSEFKKVEGEGCEADYGIVLAEFQGLFGEFTSINERIRTFVVSPQQYGDILEVFLREELIPVEERLRDLVQAYERIREVECEFQVSLPLHLEVGDSITLDLTLGNVFGQVEARIIGGTSYAFLSLIDFVFAHNLKADALSLIKTFTSMDTTSVVGIMRSLGIIFNENPEFLKWHSDELERERFDEVPEELARVFYSFHGITEPVVDYTPETEHVIQFVDSDGDGKVGRGDVIILNMSGELKVRGLSQSIEPYEAQIPIWLDEDSLPTANNALLKIGDALSGKGTPGELIHISDLNGILLAFGLEPLQDIIAIDPPAFFWGSFDGNGYSGGPKPLRELVPYWYYDILEEKYVMGIEGELKSALEIYTYYLTSGDAPHFPMEDITTQNGKVNIFIPPDCVEVPAYSPDYVMLFYIAFQDPTFNHSVYVNLSQIRTQRCDSQSQPYYYEFSPPDLYAINKVFAVLMMKYGGEIFSSSMSFY